MSSSFEIIDWDNEAGKPTEWDGKYVPISETIRSFREILDGKHDDIPEGYFINAGSIDEVRARMQ